MRRMLTSVLIGALVPSVVASAQPMRQPSWNDVKKTAEYCSLVIHRFSISTGLSNSPTWAYNIDPQSTPTQRSCFYQRMNIGEVEKVLREYDFTGQKESGR
ncbi:hypothetical protein [Novosphingobium sp. AP12]|uniref:hypothetical protein n=1 Tax=Novosphingobium sp. AP12 TaxID=1144305 RepID=UPI0002721F4F|nr:hypothetical protein [Novosphingobium sp. AP12]EJL23652.1 hypothetical protein PMI02_04091 [Novosphingobium sp. AP12]